MVSPLDTLYLQEAGRRRREEIQREADRTATREAAQRGFESAERAREARFQRQFKTAKELGGARERAGKQQLAMRNQAFQEQASLGQLQEAAKKREAETAAAQQQLMASMAEKGKSEREQARGQTKRDVAGITGEYGLERARIMAAARRAASAQGKDPSTMSMPDLAKLHRQLAEDAKIQFGADSPEAQETRRVAAQLGFIAKAGGSVEDFKTVNPEYYNELMSGSKGKGRRRPAAAPDVPDVEDVSDAELEKLLGTGY